MRSIIRKTLNRFPGLALAHRKMRHLMDRNQAATKTLWGFTLAGSEQVAFGRFDVEESAQVRELL